MFNVRVNVGYYSGVVLTLFLVITRKDVVSYVYRFGIVDGISVHSVHHSFVVELILCFVDNICTDDVIVNSIVVCVSIVIIVTVVLIGC